MGRILYDVLEINIVVTTVILLLCVFAGKLRKRYGARWMKLIWIVLVIRLLIPYNFSLPFTEVRLFSMPVFEQETMQTPESVGMENREEAKSAVNTESLGVENKPLSQIQPEIIPEFSGNSTPKVDAALQQDAKEEPQQESKVEPLPEVDSQEKSIEYTNLLVGIWLTGIVLSALYYISSYIGFQMKYRGSMKLLKDGVLLEQINCLQEEYLGKPCIKVYRSEMASSPMLVGIFAPKLVLSANVEDCQSKEFRMIVLHELCHYQQKDLWLKMLVLCAHCLNWFNPALFFMKKQCFYDIELVCDMTVLEDCDFDERELYARTMLNFAKNQKQNVSFSTNFSVSKKDLKNRISNMFDVSVKKSGFAAFLLVGVLIIGMGLFVSCGYKPEEMQSVDTQEQGNGGESDPSVSGENTASGQEGTGISNTFDYNNPYNRMICVYEGDTYLGKNDGIYLLKDNEEICLFHNDYGLFRDVTLYENKLYFCGTVMRGEQLQNTIYYVDLSTLEVKDALALFSNNFNVLYDIAIYENQLYVLDENAKKIGFMLDESGMIVKQLDSEATDYLYKEYNEYISLQIDRWNTQYGSAEWKELTKKMSDRYVPVIDVAECMELLEGKHIVYKYKDELYQSIYLVNEANEYIYLCDGVNSGEVLITTDGLYYANNESGDFSYVDFETGKTKDIYAMEEAGEVFLVNYDAKYVYFGKSIWLNDDTTKELLMRIPREGGTPEVVYSFEEGFTVNSLCLYSAIDERFMYFMNHEKVSLGRKDNLTGVFSEVSVPTKEEVLAMRAKALEGMSEQEIERLKENIKVANQRMEKAYLYEDLFGKLFDPEHLYWNYFDQKADIQIGWEPDGTPIMVYNRFDADNFVTLMEEMRDSLKSDLLKQDFDKLIECTKLAKETHEVEYAEQIYRILHDMDYFLLRYGIEDVGKYLDDLSTVAKYYGVLEIYEKEVFSEDMASSIDKILIQQITKEEAAVSPEITQYSLEEAMSLGETVTLKGGLPGTGEGTWYIVTIDGVEHFYAQYDFAEKADYYGYAIISEAYELGCGIKVGTTKEEVLTKYPYARMEDFEGKCLSDSLAPEFVCWNGVAYPRSAQGTDPDFEYQGTDYYWWNQFDYVMMLDIDLGTYDTLPIYVGLLMKEEKVRAITFYYPTVN